MCVTGSFFKPLSKTEWHIQTFSMSMLYTHCKVVDSWIADLTPEQALTVARGLLWTDMTGESDFWRKGISDSVTYRM